MIGRETFVESLERLVHLAVLHVTTRLLLIVWWCMDDEHEPCLAECTYCHHQDAIRHDVFALVDKLVEAHRIDFLTHQFRR